MGLYHVIFDGKWFGLKNVHSAGIEQKTGGVFIEPVRLFFFNGITALNSLHLKKYIFFSRYVGNYVFFFHIMFHKFRHPIEQLCPPSF